MEKDKQYNVVLGFMLFFFIIVMGFCIAWGLGYIGIKNKEVNNVGSNNLTDNNDLVTEIDNVKQDSKDTVKEIIKEVYVSKMLEFDYQKCKTATDVSNYNGAIANIYYDGNMEYVVMIDSNGEAKIRVGDIDVDYPVANLKGNVKDSMIGSYFNGDMCVYLLLEDGTIQKISDFSTFKQVGFTANSVIDGVNNIVRLETIINEGGKRIPVAIDKEGYYYVLN